MCVCVEPECFWTWWPVSVRYDESWKVLNSQRFVNMGDVEQKGASWWALSSWCCRSGSQRFRISGVDTRLFCPSRKLWMPRRALAPCWAPRNASAVSKETKRGFDRSPVSGRANDWKLRLNCHATYNLWCCINHAIVTGLLLCPSCFATLIYILEINKAREVREKSFSCRPKDSTEVWAKALEAITLLCVVPCSLCATMSRGKNECLLLEKSKPWCMRWQIWEKRDDGDGSCSILSSNVHDYLNI